MRDTGAMSDPTRVVLSAIQGLWGGRAIHVDLTAGEAIVRDVSRGCFDEKRRRVVLEDAAAIRKAVAKEALSGLQSSMKAPVPDETIVSIHVRYADGTHLSFMRPTSSAHAALEALERTLGAVDRPGGATAYEGRFDPSWVPD
jgi:hypothetical protein